jgi:hypothetical protein
MERSRFGRVFAVLALTLAALHGLPTLAQETPDQFDAANAESRRHSEAENQLRGQAHDLRIDGMQGQLHCQGAGSPSAQQACQNNLNIQMRQRGLDLNNQGIQEHNNHSQILKGIGVHRVP